MTREGFTTARRFWHLVERVRPEARKLHRLQERCCAEDIPEMAEEVMRKRIACRIDGHLDGSGLRWMEQGDCRGLPVYIYHPDDLNGRPIDEIYDSIGFAVPLR